MKTDNIKTRTLTFTIEYTNRYSNGSSGCLLNMDEATNIIAKVVAAIQSYNNNRSSSYTDANITGIWLEPEEVDVDEQNKLLDDIKNS